MKEYLLLPDHEYKIKTSTLRRFFTIEGGIFRFQVSLVVAGNKGF
ncbi:hypothetical protein [Arcticibacter eurypsychrophilus]|nr:hypothetical protein [Arcticibacter eurypsychrophilus]